MTSSVPHAPQDEPDRRGSRIEPGRPDWTGRVGWIQKRREKVVAEIERNRRGEYRVPTWVLAVALAVVVLGWAALIIFG
jgi:hypothetical protein